MRLLIFVGCFFVLMSTQSKAEPPESIKWLMNEPATLFDIGIMKMRIQNKEEWIPKLMEKIQDENLKQDKIAPTLVHYHWGLNKIRIAAIFRGDPTEERCERVLNQYKNIISPYSEVPEFKYSFILFNFGSASNRQSGPEGFERNVGKSVSVNVVIFADISNSPRKSISCSSGFESDVTSFR
jgi:hypothetical protein